MFKMSLLSPPIKQCTPFWVYTSITKLVLGQQFSVHLLAELNKQLLSKMPGIQYFSYTFTFSKSIAMLTKQILFVNYCAVC